MVQAPATDVAIETNAFSYDLEQYCKSYGDEKGFITIFVIWYNEFYSILSTLHDFK